MPSMFEQDYSVTRLRKKTRNYDGKPPFSLLKIQWTWLMDTATVDQVMPQADDAQ